jgi:hypothetical protein
MAVANTLAPPPPAAANLPQCTALPEPSCILSNPAAAPTLYNYTSSIGNVTYYLNTTMDTMVASQDTCRRLGGHLAAFSSREQQGEVERAFIAAGQFVVSYQAQYWLGMVAVVPRNFRCGAAWLLQAAGKSQHAAYSAPAARGVP